MHKKILTVVGITILLLSVAVTTTIGLSNNNDTTPPVTNISLDPPEPEGLNGWYVSDVNVTLNATDDMSGVNATYYRINRGDWEVYTEPFTLSEDGDDILIEYYSVDNARNVEDVKSSYLDIDQTEPDIILYYEIIGGDELTGWDYKFWATAVDYYSGMERVEFYVYDILQETVTGPGPQYEWVLHFPFWCSIIGLIRNKEVTDEYVSFYAIIVGITLRGFPNLNGAYAYDNAGNRGIDEIYCHGFTPIRGIYKYQNLTYPNDYIGFIGRNFIFALFDISNVVLW